MRWRKGKIDTHEGHIPCWTIDQPAGHYFIFLNVNHGLVGPNGGPGGWWYEVRVRRGHHETVVGEAPDVETAKAVAADDWESVQIEQ